MEDYDEQFEQCSECETRDGTCYPCDHCRRTVCVEHDDRPGDRGYESDLVLCSECGEDLDKVSDSCEHSLLEFDLDGKHYKSCLICLLDLGDEAVAERQRNTEGGR